MIGEAALSSSLRTDFPPSATTAFSRSREEIGGERKNINTNNKLILLLSRYVLVITVPHRLRSPFVQLGSWGPQTHLQGMLQAPRLHMLHLPSTPSPQKQNTSPALLSGQV